MFEVETSYNFCHIKANVKMLADRQMITFNK